MKFVYSFQLSSLLRRLLLAAVCVVPALVQAETWHAAVGAQSPDKARQVLAFLPNEIWIHANDTVTWTIQSDEVHTITFLKPGQIRLPLGQGFCPGFSFGGALLDGSTCVSTPPLPKGQTFSVTFLAPGNYKLVCLVHSDMTGVVHVLEPSVSLPHDQSFYDQQASDSAQSLLAEVQMERAQNHPTPPNSVATGIGETVATGGGHRSASVMRFIDDLKYIHAGDTVDWTNDDPSTPHTITFGSEPLILFLPSANVSVAADGALKATMHSPADSVHSGFIISAPQERIGLPQVPLGATRFRITFTSAGIYPYICAIHDGLGMKGTIIVLP